MAEQEEIHLTIDAMEFLQEVIDSEVDLALAIEKNGITALMPGVTAIAWEKAEEAQAGLDRMIAADETWRTPDKES